MKILQKKRPLLEPSITQYGLWTKGYLNFPECDSSIEDIYSTMCNEVLSTADDEEEVRDKLIGRMKVVADLLDAIFLQKTQSAILV